jgi:hypothetical protein
MAFSRVVVIVLITNRQLVVAISFPSTWALTTAVQVRSLSNNIIITLSRHDRGEVESSPLQRNFGGTRIHRLAGFVWDPPRLEPCCLRWELSLLLLLKFHLPPSAPCFLCHPPKSCHWENLSESRKLRRQLLPGSRKKERATVMSKRLKNKKLKWVAPSKNKAAESFVMETCCYTTFHKIGYYMTRVHSSYSRVQFYTYMSLCALWIRGPVLYRMQGTLDASDETISAPSPPTTITTS